MKTWPLRSFLVLCLLLISKQALSLEVEGFTGALNHTNIDGCCISTGSKTGFGVLARFQNDEGQEWDFSGYTDKRWSDFSVMRPRYLIGEKSQLDPEGDDAIEIRRVSDFKLMFSYGVGFFIHSTRTKLYDLPAISSGLAANTLLQGSYAIDDHWAALALARFSVAVGIDDKGYLWGLFLGVHWRP